LKAHGLPPRLLVRQTESIRQRLLHVPGVQKVNILGERPEKIFVGFDYARLATLGIGARDIFAAIQRQNVVTRPDRSTPRGRRSSSALTAPTTICGRFATLRSSPEDAP
jgi:multidrug efflux pump subunit AcrB